MKSLKILLEQKADLVSEMEGLIKKAETRELITSENKRIEEIEPLVKNLDEKIKPLQSQENINKNKATKKAMENNITTLDDGIVPEGGVFLDYKKTISLIDSKTRLQNSAVKEDGNFSLGELIMIRLRGPQNSVERSALDTSLDASGGITTRVSRNFWDRARSASTVVRAGATTLNMEDGEHGNVVIPQITGSIAPE